MCWPAASSMATASAIAAISEAGDVQWMTAGRGILHQEMPQGDAEGRMHGFQLWANLPSSLKMTAPRYQDVKAGEIPEIADDDGTRVRVVCGDFWGKRGPIEGVAADPRYLDIWVPPGKRKTIPVELERHAFAYVFEGSGDFRAASKPFGVLTEKTDGVNETVVREADRQPLAGPVRPRRRGDGAGRRPGHPFPAGLRQADRGAGRLARADRDELAGRAATGLRRIARRHVHPIDPAAVIIVTSGPGLRPGPFLTAAWNELSRHVAAWASSHCRVKSAILPRRKDVRHRKADTPAIKNLRYQGGKT